jgi:hypothetical protein
MKLCLGFQEFPYAARYGKRSPLTTTTKRGKPRELSPSQESYGQGKTTGEVAEELEEKYHIVETFWAQEEDNFVELIEEAFADDIEDIMQMAHVPKRRGISDKETDKIEAKFRQNLSQRRYDGVISGVPTIAAQRGVSHLRQHPYAKRGPRPSFIDTGMYQRSFRAWVEDIED